MWWRSSFTGRADGVVWQVTFLTRRAKGSVSERREERATDRLRFGRGTDNEVHLPDPRIALHQAAIERRAGGLYAFSAAGVDFRVNGVVATDALIKPGDRIGIGPYDVEIVAPPAGADGAVTVELVRPLGDDLAQLQARSQTNLVAAALSKRALSWTSFAIVVLLFLALPVAAFFTPALRTATKTWSIKPDTAWNSGEISRAHKFFSEDCGACHQKAFVMVEDKACVACHKSIQQHADPNKFQMADLRQVGCQSCHKEHEGPKPIVLTSEKFCVQCHDGLAARVSATTLRDAADFGRAHPEFRPTVKVDPVTGKQDRISLADKPQERSGLVFPHDKHLVPEGVRSPIGRTKLDCGSCHKPEAGGAFMQPVRMEAMCAGCHQLKFDPLLPDWTLPHGRPGDVIRLVRGLYDGLALRGGVEEPAAPAVVRRRPGTVLTEPERLDALAWAETRANDMLRVVFGKSVCGACHQVTPPAAATGAWAVQAPQIAERWLPKGGFRHDRHMLMACGDCHQAAKSNASEDVLL
ncbi:MAG: hypothetical protein FJX52_03295, partial [Alphaproteobacteria bacterium]|nr:hypothetical protein [Alphaproteobacteria bacterium]